MLLKQLVDYADRLELELERKNADRDEGERETLVPSGYQTQAIKGFIKLDLQGNFLEFYPTDGGLGKKDKGKLFAVPHVMRTAVKPKLLVDDARYVLKIGKDAADKKVEEKHAVFIKMLWQCYEKTQVVELKVIAEYLTGAQFADFIPWENFDATLNYSFEVAGVRPFEIPRVQSFWTQLVMGGEAESSSEKTGKTVFGYSLISGTYGQVMEREPVKIKNLPNAQTTGTNIISANNPAFTSYGFEFSQIAPVLVPEAEKYANALNGLLSSRAHSVRLGGMAYVFWTKEGDTPPINAALSDPAEEFADIFAQDIFAQDVPIHFKSRPEEIREAIKSIWTGQKKLDLRETDFYAVGLSANIARVVVRHHIISTVSEVLGKLGYFFASQKMVSPKADEHSKPHGVYALASSLYRDFRKESANHDLDALLAYALEGSQILPHHFLQRLSARNRAEKRVTYPRAVLTKMVLISRKELDMGQLEELQMDYPNIGYQLGRLLAALDNIQSAVMSANTTLVDRFYGSMSTTPKAVWGRLIQGTQHHLAKLRKEKPGVYVLKQKMLEEINSRILPQDIPNVLSLEGQALFSLGYYHQRAAIGKEIQDAREAKALRADAVKQIPLENNSDNPQENQND